MKVHRIGTSPEQRDENLFHIAGRRMAAGRIGSNAQLRPNRHRLAGGWTAVGDFRGVIPNPDKIPSVNNLMPSDTKPV